MASCHVDFNLILSSVNIPAYKNRIILFFNLQITIFIKKIAI